MTNCDTEHVPASILRKKIVGKRTLWKDYPIIGVCLNLIMSIYKRVYNIWLVVETPLLKILINGKDYPIYYGK